MNRKAKGTRAERDLIHKFNKNGWVAIRTAGSGSSQWPAPDIMAGNAMRRVAIECKTSKQTSKYIPACDIDQIKHFSDKFGAEAWVALKFDGYPWYFMMIEDLRFTGKSYTANLELCKLRGLEFSHFIDRNL